MSRPNPEWMMPVDGQCDHKVGRNNETRILLEFFN